VSPLLRKLTSALERTTEPLHRAELLARIGCCLARVGQIEDARKIVSELRTDFGAGQSGKITVWIMLTEGLIHWFGSISGQALDRVVRAQVLSVAMQYPLGIAISSAWKAYFELEQAKHEDFFQSIRLAHKHACGDDHDVLARITILLCSASATAGNPERAKYWFHRGRHYALLDGDQASIEALQYNRSAFTLSWARAENCLQKLDKELLRDLRLEIDSARNLQVLTGVAPFKNYLHLSHARLLVLEGKFEEAIAEFTNARLEEPFLDYQLMQLCVDIEIAFCQLRLERHNEVERRLEGLDFSLAGKLELDDQLFVAFARYEMSRVDARFGDAGLLADQLLTASSAYAAGHTNLRDCLNRFEADIPSI
jgi:hypothetical protein